MLSVSKCILFLFSIRYLFVCAPSWLLLQLVSSEAAVVDGPAVAPAVMAADMVVAAAARDGRAVALQAGRAAVEAVEAVAGHRVVVGRAAVDRVMAGRAVEYRVAGQAAVARAADGHQAAADGRAVAAVDTAAVAMEAVANNTKSSKFSFRQAAAVVAMEDGLAGEAAVDMAVDPDGNQAEADGSRATPAGPVHRVLVPLVGRAVV